MKGENGEEKAIMLKKLVDFVYGVCKGKDWCVTALAFEVLPRLQLGMNRWVGLSRMLSLEWQ